VDFEWIDDKTALRMGSDFANRGFTAPEIRQIAQARIRVDGIDEFPGGCSLNWNCQTKTQMIL